MLIVSLLLTIVLVVVIYIYKTTIYEVYGDYQIKKTTDFLLKSEDYYVMKNIVLLTFDGLQKFDYIIVSRFGVFVVMVQHYSGLIEGNENASTWTQITNGKVSLKFANPIKVINERSDILSGLLKIPKTEVYPVALFSGISGFSNPLTKKITYGAEYLKYIFSKNKVIFSAKQIDKFVSIIEAKRKKQGLVNHSELAEKSQKSVSSLEQDNICPKCGSELEIRDADSESSLGRQMLVCSLYPTCRHRRAL